MYTDIVDLCDFYESRLGQTARRLLRRRVRELWPDVRGQSVLGLGFAGPVLTPFRDEAKRVISFMPAQQGVMRWPASGANAAALVDETALPLPDASVERVVVLHALESTEALRPMLEEIWRVLTATGRVLVIVPNRTGIWARSDRSPFSFGHPYTASQLSRRLRDSLLVPHRVARMLYLPPSRSRVMLRAAQAWEEIGRRWFPTFGGLVAVEASKQVYHVQPLRQPSRLRPALMPVGTAQPARTVLAQSASARERTPGRRDD